MGSFCYQSASKKFERAFTRTIGMYLFKLRQHKKFAAEKVCREVNIHPHTLDCIEIGKGHIRWRRIQRLMEYYKVKFKFDFYYCEKQNK